MNYYFVYGVGVLIFSYFFKLYEGVYPRSKKITNEELCAALITHGTIKETAAVLNISVKTVYNMMSDNEFKQMYEYAQADILNNSVKVCQSKVTEAINCIADIMNDKSVNAQTRLQAAQTMLKTSTTMYELAEKMRDKAEHETKSIFDDLL